MTAPHDVSVASILSSLPTGVNAFTFLYDSLHSEFYPNPSPALLRTCKAFIVIQALTLAGSLFTLAVRFRAGERSLYHLQRTPHGTYIVPNVLGNWIAFNVIYIATTFPFVVHATSTSGNLRNSPLWMCLVFIPLFFGVWITAYGTVVAAVQQSQRLYVPPCDTSLPPPGYLASLYTVPTFLNSLFILGLVSAPAGMVYVTVIGTEQYNVGIDAFNLLNSAIVAIGIDTPVPSIIDVLPQADQLLSVMSASLWHFELPFGVCVTFASIAGVAMLLAGSYQLQSLRQQISYLRLTIQDDEGAQLHDFEHNSILTNNIERKLGLIRILRNCIATTILIFFSMAVYCFVCVAAKLNWSTTPIFHMYTSSRGHLIVLFVYSLLDLIVVCCVLFQTLDPAACRQRSAVSFASSSISSDSKLASSSYPIAHQANASRSESRNSASRLSGSFAATPSEMSEKRRRATVDFSASLSAFSAMMPRRVSLPTAIYAPRHSLIRPPTIVIVDEKEAIEML